MSEQLFNLNIKSDENYKVALYAKQNGFINPAISRVYYSVYQKILIIKELEKCNPILKLAREEVKKSITEPIGEHQLDIKTIDRFVKSNSKFKKHVFKITQLESFRRLRNTADYSCKLLKDSDFKTAERVYKDATPVLDEIIKTYSK